jgi:hypothetical protein
MPCLYKTMIIILSCTTCKEDNKFLKSEKILSVLQNKKPVILSKSQDSRFSKNKLYQPRCISGSGKLHRIDCSIARTWFHDAVSFHAAHLYTTLTFHHSTRTRFSSLHFNRATFSFFHTLWTTFHHHLMATRFSGRAAI